MGQTRKDSSNYLERTLDGFDLSVRTSNCLRNAGILTLGDLAALRSVDILGWRNAGNKTLHELKRLLSTLGLKLSEPALSKQGDIFENNLAVASSASLEEELFGVLRAIGSDRNSRILVRRLGWAGDPPRTLESVGLEFSLTRERVRQLEKRAIQRLQKYHFKTPYLALSIATLRKLVPDTEVALGAALQDRDISQTYFSLESLRVAADLLRTKWPFEVNSVGDSQVLSLPGEGAVFREAMSLVRKKTSERGCVSMLSLASELGLADSSAPGLRRVLDAAGTFEWLDDEKTWLRSLEATRNRLFNLCSKVLGVAPRVHVSELRHAVSRSRRLAMCPPNRVLLSFVKSTGLGETSESFIVSSPGSGAPPPPDSAEGLMLRVLDAQGPAMDGEAFAEACISAGVNATTFYVYRAVSPVICALGKNIFSKVGAEVPPGTVERIVGSRRMAARFSDHGWTRLGRLWYGAELSRQVFTGGGIRLPASIASFVNGEWNVVLPDGSAYGTVTSREPYIWSFRKPFDLLGAEPTDLVVFEFDLKSRQVFVRVGGKGMIEAMQASDDQPLEDVLDS